MRKNANNANPSQQQLSSLLQYYHNERFAEAEKLIRKAIDDSEDDELKEAAEGMQIESSKEGLRIQLLDQEKVALFPLGSDEMNERTRNKNQHPGLDLF